MDIKLVLKSSVAAAALVAVAAPVVSGSAQAGLANGNDNSVTMSGQIVRSMMYADDGNNTEFTHVEGGNDTDSRFRIIVKGKLTESVDVGGLFEARLPLSDRQSEQSSDANGVLTREGDQGNFGFRKSEVTFSHATMGKLSIGQSSTSSDNRPSLGFAGNTNGGITNGGGLKFYDSVGKTQTVVSGDQFSSYFGTRDDRLRYDTPSMGGLKLSVSTATEITDVGLNYGATYGDVTVSAAAAYAALDVDTKATDPEARYGAGVALTHTSGFGASVYYGTEDSASGSTIEGETLGFELGYKTSAMSNLGETGFALVYISSEEAANDKGEATLWGLHARQSMPAGVSVFASYSMASYEDGTTASYDDISVALIGTQVNF